MAGVQEEFGNRLGEGYMANLGESDQYLSLSYRPASSSYSTRTSPAAYPYLLYSSLVLSTLTHTDKQNKHNQQYQSTNPFVKSSNLDD